MDKIGTTVTHEKSLTVKDIQLEYDVIVKDLSKFDVAKEELECQTEDLITTMDKANEYYTIIKYEINDTVIAQAELDKDTEKMK